MKSSTFKPGLKLEWKSQTCRKSSRKQLRKIPPAGIEFTPPVVISSGNDKHVEFQIEKTVEKRSAIRRFYVPQNEELFLPRCGIRSFATSMFLRDSFPS